MGPDTYIDGKIFNPEDPLTYIKAFAVKTMTLDFEQLAKINS